MLDLGLIKPVVNNDLEEAIQEVDILFNTTPTELLGDTLYGINFYKYLWQLTPSAESIKKHITDKLSSNTYYYNKFLYYINVEPVSLDVNDLAYRVEITIKTSNDADAKSIRKVYMIA